MPCTGCGDKKTIQQRIEAMNNSKWLSQEEVKAICPQCYENMVSLNISRVTKENLLSKIKKETKVKLFEVIYLGPENTKYNFGGHSLEPNMPKYFEPEELPFTVKQLKKFNELKVTEVEMEKKPTDVEINKKSGAKGIMWVGASPRRLNEHGSFNRNEARYDLPIEVVNELKTRSGFREV